MMTEQIITGMIDIDWWSTLLIGTVVGSVMTIVVIIIQKIMCDDDDE